MKIFTTIPPFDEFNSIACINWEKKEADTISRVVCFKNHDILFPRFDEVVIIEHEFDTNHTKGEWAKEFEIIKSHAKKLDENFNIYTGLAEKNGFKHSYNLIFTRLIEEIIEGRDPFFRPKKSDYLDIQEKLSKIEGKIVTINGRNVKPSKNHGRNNNLKEIIEFLISKDVTVVNCTIPSANLGIDGDKYIDVSGDCLSYSRNISYFLNSDALISIGNAGGVTNHMSTGANIILFGPGGWVDNVKFGHKGDSVFSARKKINKNTHQSKDKDEVLKLINNMERPVVTKFFDESKIKRIEDIS